MENEKMITISEVKKPEVQLKTLPKGAAFLIAGCIYLKTSIEVGPGFFSCANLQTGQVSDFGGGLEVEEIDLDIRWARK